VPTPSPVSLTVSGSKAMMPTLALLAEHFQVQHPSITVVLEPGNAFLGVEQVVNGSAALGVVAIAPPDELWVAPIAVGAIAIVVHPENSLQDLTLVQVREVFGGRTWRWSELGVEIPGDEIVVVSREEGSATRLGFESLAMASVVSIEEGCEPFPTIQPGIAGSLGTHLCRGEPVTSMAVLVPDSAAVVAFVAAHRDAIGYVSQSHVGLQVRTVRVEGVPPTTERVADGSYHLTQPFFLVARHEPTGATRKFTDLALSAEGQSIVARDFVPVRQVDR
jgi:phosphate transport system substrate-binding protein